MKKLILAVLALVAMIGPGQADTIFTSAFDGNTGATVLPGNADGTSGSATVGIPDWTTDASVTAISGLTAISPGGGFAQPNNGANVMANADTVFINHNLNVAPRTNPRGYSLTFSIDEEWHLDNLNIISGHGSATGGSQTYSHDLTYTLSGGTLGADVSTTVNIDYGGVTWVGTDFALTGTSIGAGTYTLSVSANNMVGGGAFAAFDGVTLEGLTGDPPPIINSFTASPMLFEEGDEVTLSWDVTGATSVSIDQGIGAVAAVDSMVLTPGDTTTYTLTALNGSTPASSQVTPIMSQIVEVFLLGGQSNMQGLGKLSELTPEQLTPPPGVFFWNHGAGEFEALIPGTTVTAGTGDFGPEIALATSLSAGNHKIYIIKYYASGMALDSGWNGTSYDDHTNSWLGDPPAPNRTNFYPGISPADPNQGKLYKDNMLPRFQAGIAAVTAFGYTPVVRGFVWMQGEQDSKMELSAGRYAANLKRLRDRLAEDLGLTNATDLPLVYGQVLPYSPPAPRFTYRDLIRAQQASADMDSGSPDAIPRARMVSTDGYGMKNDHVHYDTAGQLQLGTNFALGIQQARIQNARISGHTLTLNSEPGPGESEIEISWTGDYGIIYQVEKSTNLTDWNPLDSIKTAPISGTTIVVPDDAVENSAFYRVSAK